MTSAARRRTIRWRNVVRRYGWLVIALTWAVVLIKIIP